MYSNCPFIYVTSILVVSGPLACLHTSAKRSTCFYSSSYIYLQSRQRPVQIVLLRILLDVANNPVPSKQRKGDQGLPLMICSLAAAPRNHSLCARAYDHSTCSHTHKAVASYSRHNATKHAPTKLALNAHNLTEYVE